MKSEKDDDFLFEEEVTAVNSSVESMTEMMATVTSSTRPTVRLRALTPSCPDCGEPFEYAGHQTCQYPKNHQ